MKLDVCTNRKLGLPDDLSTWYPFDAWREPSTLRYTAQWFPYKYQSAQSIDNVYSCNWYAVEVMRA